MHRARQRGFTLIELSIVLVVIGLIVGGVLVGQDLIKAAQVRATVTQLERFQTATNTFYGKFNCIPGDCKNAASFGFPARGIYPGEGDGNGLIEGCANNGTGQNAGYLVAGGETAVFWEDLSQAGLIDGLFNTASITGPPASNITISSSPAISAYMPSAKLGQGNYFYVYSYGSAGSSTHLNYFGLSAVAELTANGDGQGGADSTPGLTVNQAYSIDTKIDDGLPQSGQVTAVYLDAASGHASSIWAAGGGTMSSPNEGQNYAGNPYTAATPGSSNTCYDNGNVAGATQQYSTEQNGGTGMNCALTFLMQGAAR